MKKSIKLLALIVFIVFALSACTDNGGDNMNNDPDIMCGGTVDRSYDAPKVIESKELTSIETEFFYGENYINAGGCDCLRIKLERNEKNELFLSESYRYGVSTKVGDEVLVGARELIDKLKLAELNGTDKYTSGLPQPYSPVFFKAEYASGEKIYFCMDGNPQENWCNELAEYFLNVFAEYGETSVLPPRESVEIIRFEIGYFDGTVSREYISALSKDDEEKILKIHYDNKTEKSLAEEYIDVPENYYSELEVLLKELKANKLINMDDSFSYHRKTLGVKSFYIFIEHADNSQDFGYYEGEGITTEMIEKIQKIMSHIDKYFEH